MHGSHASGVPVLDVAVLALAALGVVVYVTSAVASRANGRPWPRHRSVLWCAGVAAGAASVVGPLAAAAHDDFVAHMAAHLLAGMVAPLLLVLAAPVTLALRALAATPARRVSRMLRSTPARIVSHPVTAGIVSAGGLWVIYLTPVLDAVRADPLAHLLVHAHLLAAGYLFTAAIIGLDPRPHPSPRAMAVTVLVATMAAHSILAKYLYAHPPVGYEQASVEAGAQLMYYGGAWIEGTVVVVFCAQWYRAAGRRSARAATTVDRGRPLRPHWSA